ncbi:unnamed protein product (mitochondrion) [Plasmodiophora brassicae]|uniref:Uncharacterized protein n=1 Tax=Plasmodiophora brassicae TaxID=37360 RepID=A0A3P3YEF6_PLABS|nr:unnamed protein product [Plasmodiophora brassicae]
MTPQRKAIRNEMKALCAAYYGDAYIKTDWLRHRGDLSEQDVDQYSYNHTYLMIKTEIARRRDDLGIRPHHRTAPTRTHPYAIMFGAYPPELAKALWPRGYALRRRGYALFTRLNLASVCVGQHHPLANKLFSPDRRLEGPFFGPP